MNRIDAISFCGIKYTSAGKKFVEKQDDYVKKTISAAEKRMKHYKYTNFIVNAKGYSVQYSDESGLHSYKVNEILHSCEDDVSYHTIGANSRVFKFAFAGFPEKARECALYAALDATNKNAWLNSTIQLTNLLEKTGGNPIKKSLFGRMKDTIKRICSN